MIHFILLCNPREVPSVTYYQTDELTDKGQFYIYYKKEIKKEEETNLIEEEKKYMKLNNYQSASMLQVLNVTL